MACVRGLVGGLQRLSLSSSALGPAALSPAALGPAALGPASAATSTSGLITALLGSRSLHCSAVCARKLDNRAYPAYKHPSSKKGRWEERKKFSEMYEYTTKPLPFPKTGGRGPNGRIWNHKRGGGHKRNFRMISWIRGGPSESSNETLVERVDSIRYDPNRSARIALVASGNFKRYIIATQNMKRGDLIKSSTHLGSSTVRGSEGDSYPLGALPIGTLVNSVQRFPEDEGRLATAAGVTATVLRKLGDQVVVRLPSRHEVSVSARCQATIGRVSNIDHDKRVIGKAGRNRWLGIRPSSGRWHRKDGRFGRKIRPLPPLKVYDQKQPRHAPKTKYTF